MTMPAGTYYVGDLCYVMHDAWNEVCDLLFEGRDDQGCNQGEFQLKDGRRFAIYNTAWGDGTYPSNGFGRFAVDAGSIGCLLKEDIRDESPNNLEYLGAIVEYDNDFSTWNDDGNLYFGRVVVYTGDEEEEDWEDEYEEEEE